MAKWLALARRVGEDLARAGMEDARLIRNLDMVEFSFGFAVSETPETPERIGACMSGYGVSASTEQQAAHLRDRQQNQAIYIQLDAGIVAAFLQRNGVLAEAPVPPRTIGSALIESYQIFWIIPERFFGA